MVQKIHLVTEMSLGAIFMTMASCQTGILSFRDL